MNPPIAAEDATADPEIEPKSIAAMILTKAKPPGNIPTRTLAKSMSRLAIPPLFMSCPESIKKGIASSAKLSRPVAMRCAAVVKAGPAFMLSNMVEIAAIPILKDIGTPIDKSKTKLTISTIM